MILTFGPCIEREYSLKVLSDTQSFLSMSGQTIPFPVGQGQPHQQGPTVGTLGTWSVPISRSPSDSQFLLGVPPVPTHSREQAYISYSCLQKLVCANYELTCKITPLPLASHRKRLFIAVPGYSDVRFPGLSLPWCPPRGTRLTGRSSCTLVRQG